MVFVEVKTRSTFKFGFPDESIDHKKENRLREAAEIYIEQENLYNEIRFDIISIVKIISKKKYTTLRMLFKNENSLVL